MKHMERVLLFFIILLTHNYIVSATPITYASEKVIPKSSVKF